MSRPILIWNMYLQFTNGYISKMPARVKCAVLGWHTMEDLLGEKDIKE